MLWRDLAHFVTFLFEILFECLIIFDKVKIMFHPVPWSDAPIFFFTRVDIPAGHSATATPVETFEVFG